MAQQIKITQTSNADMNIGVPKTLTAVEWLDESLQQNVIAIDYVSRIMILEINIEDFMELKNKAKQMEKKQIIDAFEIGWKDEDRIGEEYYNETFTSTQHNGNPSAT